ncbi:MAG: L-threonylcarbamoyladenylate synthase [Kiritimatiellae bacterium]|nr:L-threonylcarbamoyladenylate synthase [Kiritimatiellia bacterium]
MKIVACDEAGLAEVASVLNAGGVAVIPTDTVYGLAAHPDFPEAVSRLYTIKGREARKPIALLASDTAAAARFLGGELPPGARTLAMRGWPGALTLVLPVQGSAEEQYEGLRVPDHDWTRRLLAACGGVLRVTSANLSGQRAATDAPSALAEVGLSADIVVDDGISPGGVASTVLKIDGEGACTVLREGPFKLGPGVER